MKKTLLAISAVIALAFTATVSVASEAVDKTANAVYQAGEYLHAQLFNYMASCGMILGANVLTNLAADIYKAADMVAREQVGAITSVTINGDGSERAAVGDNVRSFFTRSVSLVDNTPSMTIPEGTDQTIDNKVLQITKNKGVPIPWTGEDMRHVNNGSGFETIYGDQIKQAMRAITNQVEVDLMTEAYLNASRAWGSAGTTPFGSNFSEIANLRQILVDNGCPMDGQSSIVLNTLAGTALRNLAQLQKTNEAGNDLLLRQGELLNLQGLMLKESAGAQTPTKGTGASYTTSAAGFAVGTTSIPIITGTGTVLQGDVVTFAGDTNKYVVQTGVSAPGTIVLAEPGLRVAIAASATAMTIGNTATKNVAFHKSAIELAIRAPAMPEGGDAAVDAMTVQDPRSGLVFEIRAYKGFQKAMFNVSAAWGVKAWKRENIVQLLG